MKKLFFMAVAAIAALSSCTSDNDLELNKNTGKEALTFTATMEDSEATRATYDNTNLCAAWEVGDQISINGKIYSAQAAGTTSTFTADGEGATGTTYNAYFPADLYDGTTATLPANVSETWTDGKFNMPMYAESETTTLAFKNLCGVLKITVTSDQLASVKCITVSSSYCATSGAFTVDANKAAVLTNASNTANTVTVTYTAAVTTDATGKVFYVAIPAQTYKNLSIAVSDGTTTKSMTTKKDANILVERNKIYPITFKDNSVPPAPTGALSGMFSVSDTKQVYFSKGNLYYDGSAFKFEDNQYSIATGWSTSHVSNFFWSKTAADAYAGSCSYETATAGDVFFTNASDFTVNGQTGVWRTLSHAEWNYLFNHYAYKYTSVNGKSGLVIAPAGKTVEDISDYTADAWATAESNGFVFLPNTGYRYGTSIPETDKSCLYWSSTLSSNNKPYRQFFQWDSSESSLKKDFEDATLCYWGIGIRLVTDVK